MTRPIPQTIETFDSVEIDAAGKLAFRPLTLLNEGEGEESRPKGYSGYLVPYYSLSDRGTFFVPGAARKTSTERLQLAPVLYQHDTWEPIGRHTAAVEDNRGFRVEAAVNVGTDRGRETMSNLGFGVPMGLSIGMERMADRSGTEDDDLVLDRSTAPDYMKNLPINELRAVTEFRWWEGSVVTFAAIASAKPDQIRLTDRRFDVGDLLTQIREGMLSAEDLAQLSDAITHALSAADPDPASTEERERAALNAYALVNAGFADLQAKGVLN